MITYRRLIGWTTLATLLLIMLGAYVRLSDAGLGCPDWPGCYGKLTPSAAAGEINQAIASQGGEHGWVSMSKAWKEMAHRYIASLLGLAIIAIAWMAVRYRQVLQQSPLLAVALVGVVIMQGLFGKWTVTLLLRPAIVTGHLMGGMLTFGLLVWLWRRQTSVPRYVDAEPVAALRQPARIALILLIAQIFLGGWVSTNYAALACPDLPTCQQQWWPETHFSDAFHLFRELGRTADGAGLSIAALTAIHMTHRLGAIVLTLYLLWLSRRILALSELRGIGIGLLGVLALQLVLGLSNVYFSLPLPVAVFHNGGAALLLGVLVVLNFQAFRARLRV
jgi:heme a synthase